MVWLKRYSVSQKEEALKKIKILGVYLLNRDSIRIFNLGDIYLKLGECNSFAGFNIYFFKFGVCSRIWG